MSALVDTSVLIDVLRGRVDALEVLESARRSGPLHASEVTRAEVLAGMRPREAAATTAALEALTWHPVDRLIAERAGELARQWRTSHGGIDLADFLIAATAQTVGAHLLTRNVRHFPMIDGLVAPY